MKKDGLLFLGLAALGFGLFMSFRRSAPAQKVGSTNTGSAAVGDYWSQLLTRGTAIAGQSANRAVGGNVDFTPAIGALANVFNNFINKYFRDKEVGGRSDGTSPGNSSGYGTVKPTASDYEGGGFVGPTWTTPGQVDYLYDDSPVNDSADFHDYNDLFDSSSPISDSYDSATDREFA